jgi:trehalose 6-phosphate synthase/phosphatase
LIFLDYDGTLVAYFPLPLQANPSEHLVELLRKLSSSEQNEIFIISGRDADSLETWMGFLPLNIIAEHGARIKMKHKEWEMQTLARSDWKTEVKNIMQQYVVDCPNSFIEEKQFSIAWHYRNASEDRILNSSGELVAALKEYGNIRGLQVISGNKIVEVRNYGIDKGTAVKKIIAATTYDFILAAGDDKTDEDMFRVLSDNPEAITIKIGGDASYAKYNLHTPQMAISLLEAISNY